MADGGDEFMGRCEIIQPRRRGKRCWSKEMRSRVGHLVVPGQFRALCQLPVMEAVHQGAGQVLAGIGIQPIDLALDVEDGVDPFHRFQRDRRDMMGGFALSHVPGNIRQFEELPARMRC